MVGTIIWVYLIVRFVNLQNTASMVVAAMLPFGVLWLFKYTEFTLDTFQVSEQDRDPFAFFLVLALPPGISFYTFQCLSYLVDARRHSIRSDSEFLHVFAYVSFFPQLVAGPIVRFHEISAQLKRISSEKNTSADFRLGIKFLAFGLFGKMFGADIIASMRSNLGGVPTSSIDALFDVLGYSVQIYFDFWGYSIMAIGIGLMMGIRLPVNFREPYLSASPREFWRRWHITLSYWFRDYLYLVLGGNNNYLRNILIVFLLCGLWHGAGWNFVAWGGYHAVLVIGYHLTQGLWDRLPRFIQISMTFSLVSLGWPLFAYGFEGYAALILTLFSFNAEPAILGLKHWLYLGLILVFVFFIRERIWLYNEGRNWLFDSPVLHAILFYLSVLFLSFRQTFIYFSF